MLGDDTAAAELKSDVAEMERLVHLYLDFARGEGTETTVETDIAELIEDVAEIIGVPQNTVKTGMFYARKRIGELLAARGLERAFV